MLEVVTDAELDELYENIASATTYRVTDLVQNVLAELRELRADVAWLRGALRLVMPLTNGAWCVRYPAVCDHSECQLSAATPNRKDGEA